MKMQVGYIRFFTFIGLLTASFFLSNVSFSQTEKQFLDQLDTLRLRQFEDPHHALVGTLNILEKASEMKLNRVVAEAHVNIALILNYQDLHAQALEYYFISLDDFTKMRDTAKIGWINVDIGNIYFHNGSYDKAKSFYEDARAIFERYGAIDYESTAIDNLGLIAIEQGNYELAMNYFQESLQLRKLHGKVPFNILHSYNNIGDLYLMMGDTIKAKDYYHKIAKAKECSEELNLSGRVHHYLGKIYLHTGDNEKALAEFNRARENFTRVFNGKLLCQLNMDIANYFLHKEDYSRAYMYLHMVDSMAATHGLYKLRIEVLDQLISHHQRKNDFAKAFYYDKIRDSANIAFHDNEMQKALNSMESVIELLKTQNILNEQKIRLYNNKLTLFFLAGLALLLVAFTVYIYYSLSRKRKTDRLLQQQKADLLNQKLNIEKLKHQEDLKLLEARERELATSAMHMVRLNEISLSVAEKLKSIATNITGQSRKELQEILNEVEMATQTKAWQEFETRFEKVHQGFYIRLLDIHQVLSPTEIRICGFIRLNMTSKDIAILTNRSLRTIEGTRNSIRRKLNLDTEVSLTKYLLSI